ncbi:MAG TPA: hypothetical protein EYH10_05275 [Deltaproteobacteria bacterium]|nr:hypothetical protein [Deltaproteobacteria bacterium]
MAGNQVDLVVEGAISELAVSMKLTQNQLKLFLVLSFVITLPFALLVLLDQIKNESGLMMIFPMILGLPWVLIYILLPFDIPGFTSPPSPSTSGDMVLTMSELFLFMIPVYINIYLFILVVCKEGTNEK